METVITIKGMIAVKNEKAPRVFETNQGRFRVWPTINDGDPNPIVNMFQAGILDSFKITYTEKPWTNDEGRTFQQRYVETALRATPEDMAGASAVEANAMQNAADAAARVSGDAPAPTTPQTATASPDASSYDIRYDTPAMIFITGIVGRAMGSGRFEAGEIEHLTQYALSAWHNIPDKEALRRTYTTDTDEWTETHERPLKSDESSGPPMTMDDGQPESPPVEAYE